MERIGDRISTSLIAMNIVLLIAVLMVPFAGAAPPVPPGEEGIYHLVPKDSTAQYCENVTIDVRVNSSIPIRAGMLVLDSDVVGCGEIVDCEWNSTEWPSYGTQVIMNSSGGQNAIGDVYIPGGYRVYITFRGQIELPPGDYSVAEIEVHCNCTSGCLTDLLFYAESGELYITNNTEPWDYEIPGENGTFQCQAPQQSFSEYLPDGWNLISLPLVPEDNNTSSVLASVWANVTSVYSYNGTTKLFEDASIMDPGKGYFVNMAAADTWSYEGNAYTSMDVSLEQGLNMIGWLNCTKDISDALSSVDGKYRYVARWNVTTHKFEVYVPGAPSVFNDFTTMERGEGYFIAAKTSCTLTYP